MRCTAGWGWSRTPTPTRCIPCSGKRSARLPTPTSEQMYSLQREALRAFAHTHGWRFLDLREPLRGAVRGGEVWLYGYYDQSHLSPQGTAIVADVLAAELLKIIRSRQG